jgi:cytochrome c oxidase assembly factor CtaG
MARPGLRPAMVARPVYRPLSRREMAKRRRQHVFFVLGAAAVVTLAGYLATGSSKLFAFHMVADLVLAGYVYLLVQIRRLGELRSRRADWYHAA